MAETLSQRALALAVAGRDEPSALYNRDQLRQIVGGDYAHLDPMRVPPEWYTSEAALRLVGRADWADVDPRLEAWALLMVAICRRAGVPVWPHCARRSVADQRRAVAAGHSKTRRSAHLVGYAVDIVHGIRAWDLTPRQWLVIGALGREAERRYNDRRAVANRIALVWGGDWRRSAQDVVGWDPAHWEIRDYRSLAPMPHDDGAPPRRWRGFNFR